MIFETYSELRTLKILANVNNSARLGPLAHPCRNARPKLMAAALGPDIIPT